MIVGSSVLEENVIGISPVQDKISNIESIDEIHHQIEQLQSWMWWEDHAVLRNSLILISILVLAGISFLIANYFEKLTFLMIGAVFIMVFVLNVFMLQKPMDSSNDFIVKHFAPHHYEHLLNQQKENIKDQKRNDKIEKQWDNAKKQKGTIQSVQFDDDIKVKVHDKWYTVTDDTGEYIENHVDNGYEIKYKTVGHQIWILGFKS